MMIRGHEAIPITQFQGLFQRDQDGLDTPLDHFTDGNNFQFIGDSIRSRFGVGVSQENEAPLKNTLRQYNYPTSSANTLLVLCLNDDGITGDIYHVVNKDLVYGPILSIEGMFDFAFVPYAGRAYISPFGTFPNGDLFIQKGLEDEFLYVYLGDGTDARVAAGVGPTNTPLTIANGVGGNTDPGFHLFGTVYEYDTGYLSPISQITGFTTSANNSVSFSGIQTTGDATVVRVHLVATKVIPSYSGNNEGYQFFFLPNGSVDNGTLVKNNLTFFDADLLDDASHLIDNYTQIPAGCGLSIYNDRLVLNTTFDDISILLISEPGEPEAINQVEGVLIVPPDGNPITCTQELRDVLYVFKRAKTTSFTDNDDVPSSWKPSNIDTALGCPVHGIATVLDSGGVNVDYLFVATFTGIVVFNGRYVVPELTWKESYYWSLQDKNLYRLIQIVNESNKQWILCVMPDHSVLVGDYSMGLSQKKIRWTRFSFNMIVNCIAIANNGEIILGSRVR